MFCVVCVRINVFYIAAVDKNKYWRTSTYKSMNLHTHTHTHETCIHSILNFQNNRVELFHLSWNFLYYSIFFFGTNTKKFQLLYGKQLRLLPEM